MKKTVKKKIAAKKPAVKKKAAAKPIVKAVTKPSAPARAEGSIQAIREVFGYLRRYHNQVFVIKIEDALMGLPLFSLLVRDIVLLHQTGIRIVLVPGAKSSIDTMLERYKVKSKTVEGVRITTPEA